MSEENDQTQGLRDIYTPERATEMAKAALEAEHDHPDDYIRALVPILDQSKDMDTRDALAWLISGAFVRSCAFEMALADYLDGIRAGLDVSEEWRRARYGDPPNEGDPLPDRGDQVQFDYSGGLLPPIPMSKELRAALDADAKRCARNLAPHALVVLETHYGLYDASSDPIPPRAASKSSRKASAKKGAKKR